MKKIGYFRPHNCKYTWAEVIHVEGDTVHCSDKNSNYTESLSKLIELTTAPNPDWHGTPEKPLIIIK